MNWNISQLDVAPAEGDLTDVVVTAHWECVDSVNGFEGRAYGTTKLPAPTEDFTQFPDLTLDQVLGWVWSNGVDKDATEALVVAQIEAQENPPIIYPPLPWVEG